MTQGLPRYLLALWLKKYPYSTYGHETYQAHRVSHALYEPKSLHEPAPHRVLQGPDEPSKSGGRVHYIHRSGSTA